MKLPKLSPFAVPMLMEIGREPVYGGQAFDQQVRGLIGMAVGWS